MYEYEDDSCVGAGYHLSGSGHAPDECYWYDHQPRLEKLMNEEPIWAETKLSNSYRVSVPRKGTLDIRVTSDEATLTVSTPDGIAKLDIDRHSLLGLAYEILRKETG